MKSSSSQRRGASAPGSVRIVGGMLRGSRLAVIDMPDLRPTPDRVRETLFNWLAPTLPGARCLDLFAGTGALGIEALSRGAESVDFFERDARLAQALRDNLQRLKQTAAKVSQIDAFGALAHASSTAYDLVSTAYDLVFIDPPFAANLWANAAALLEAHDWLGANALIYIEAPATAEFSLPANWRVHRDNRAGAVRYALYRRSAKLGAD